MHVPYKFSSLWVHRALRTMQARHTKWCDTLCATQWGAKKKQSRTRLCLNDFEGGFARHFCAHWQRGCWISIFCWPCVACTSCNRSLETVAHPSTPSANDHSTACPCPAPRRLCTGRCSQLSWERSPRPPASSSSAQATHHCWLFWNGRSLLSQPSASLQMARRRSHLYVTICVCGFLHNHNAALTSNHALGPHNMLVRHLLPWKTCSHHPRHWKHFGIRFQRRTNWPYCTRTCPWCGQLHRFQISNLTKLQWMILQHIFSQLFSYPFCTRKSQLAIKAMAAQELKHLCLEPKQDNVEECCNMLFSITLVPDSKKNTRKRVAECKVRSCLTHCACD